MNVTTETLAIFLLLIPGFISSAIINAIVVRKSRSNSTDILEALVFSFLIYALLAPFFDGTPILLESTTAGGSILYRPVVKVDFLVAATFLSMLLPVLIGASITNDLHMTLLRAMRITHRTARDNTWLDIFVEQRRYVIMTLKDGRKLFGWPQYYSNDPDEGLIYLYEPAWIQEEDRYIDAGVHGILLRRQEQVESIEFTHLVADRARTAGQGGAGDVPDLGTEHSA